jgi:hypothetical protein
VDIDTAAYGVSLLLASAAGKELAQEAGKSLAEGVVERIRRVFGSDRRAIDALEQATKGDTSGAIEELTAALRWYAERDSEFATELMRWAEENRLTAVHQQIAAGRDAYTAGRDQTIIGQQRSSD